MATATTISCAMAAAFAVWALAPHAAAYASAAAAMLVVGRGPAVIVDIAPQLPRLLAAPPKVQRLPVAFAPCHSSLRSRCRSALQAKGLVDSAAEVGTTDIAVRAAIPHVDTEEPTAADGILDPVSVHNLSSPVASIENVTSEKATNENLTSEDDSGGAGNEVETRDILQRAGFAITATAAVGAADCAYLTMVKLGQAKLSCPIAAGACLKVLNSEWATVGPIPLAAIGCLAYVGVMGLSLSPDWPQRSVLWGLSLAMAVFSGGLMGLLIFQLQTPCLFCAVSAFASALLLALVEAGRARKAQGVPRRELLVVSGLVTAASLRAVTLPAPPGEESFRELTEWYKPDHPPVRSSSSRAEIALAKHLKAIGAACYTAWWCPHCQEQRENFGREAVELAPFYQCSDLEQETKAMCSTKDIDSYPTWIIDGKSYGGIRDLSELAELTGFTEYPTDSFKPRTEEQTAYIWGQSSLELEDLDL